MMNGNESGPTSDGAGQGMTSDPHDDSTRDSPSSPRVGSSPPSTLPDHFGRYLVRSRIGQGGFGEVFRGWDPLMDREVAIKVLRSDMLATPDRVADFLAEARKAGKLEQPGVVSIYDVGEEAQRCYIVERFIDGPTLADRIAKGRIDFEESVLLIFQLAEVLHKAHTQGWVHRDIKPANILLEQSRTPYLADFGLAMELEAMRATDTAIAGTPRYMAPEVIALFLKPAQVGDRFRLPRPDHRCDIYSLGVVLYEMLAGRPPYQAASRDELFTMIDRADPSPPRLYNPAIPVWLEEVCLKAIAHDPARRYRTAADFAEALKGEGNEEAPTQASEARRLARRRMRLSILGGVVLLLVVLLVLLIRAIPWGPPTPPAAPSAPSAPLTPVAATIDPAELKRMLRELRNDQDERRERQRNEVPAVIPSKKPAPSESRTDDAGLPEPYKSKYEGPLKEARQKGDEPGEFSLLLKATNELVDAGLPGPARVLAQRMVEVAGKNEAQVPIAFGQLGLTEYRLGWAEEAIADYEMSNRTYTKYYEKLLNLPEAPKVIEMRSSMARLLGLSLNRVGNANKLLKRLGNARAAYLEAIGLLEKYEDRRTELAMVLSNLGSLESGAGEHQAAAEALERALGLLQGGDHVGDRCDVLINLGNARSRAGDDETAVAAYKQAYEMMPAKASYESRSAVLSNWIQSLLELRRGDEARKLLPQLRRIVRPEDKESNRVLELLGSLIDKGT